MHTGPRQDGNSLGNSSAAVVAWIGPGGGNVSVLTGGPLGPPPEASEWPWLHQRREPGGLAGAGSRGRRRPSGALQDGRVGPRCPPCRERGRATRWTAGPDLKRGRLRPGRLIERASPKSCPPASLPGTGRTGAEAEATSPASRQRPWRGEPPFPGKRRYVRSGVRTAPFASRQAPWRRRSPSMKAAQGIPRG